MLRADRIIIILYIFSLAGLLVSKTVMPFIDEAATVFLIILAIADSTINGRWKQYTGLWILLGIMAFYSAYSLTIVHFNSVPYVLLDALLESKPFVAFFTFFAIAPIFTHKEKRILQISALAVGCISILVLMMGLQFTLLIFGHPFVAGSLAFIGAISYWYGSTDNDGNLSKHDRLVVLFLLCGGLLCTRSKYYGCFVISIFFLFFYRPGLLRHVNIKHMAMVLSLCIIVVAVAWNKITYYFITGNSDILDPNLASSMARAALLVTTPLILWDFLPFGSGLASYASHPSAANYSGLYPEYNLDKVWGLSPTMPDFITDLYFASLAQVGIVGIILFIYFWIFAYRYLKSLIRSDTTKYKNLFSIGSIIICFVPIECVGGNTFVQPSGHVAMMLLGIICGQSKRLIIKKNTSSRSKEVAVLESPKKTKRFKI